MLIKIADRKAQSILEYLVVIIVLIAVFIAMRPTMAASLGIDKLGMQLAPARNILN